MVQQISSINKIVKDFSNEVKIKFLEDIDEYNMDKDFYWAVFSVSESSMKVRKCICDEGIVREGQILA
jgi:hypothetical protein